MIIIASVSNQLPLKFCPRLPMQDLSSQVLVLICIYNNYGILERGTGGGPILKLHSVPYMRVPALDIRQLLPITAPIIACLYTMRTLSEINVPCRLPHPCYCMYIIRSATIQSAIYGHYTNTYKSIYKNECTTIATKSVTEIEN